MQYYNYVTSCNGVSQCILNEVTLPLDGRLLRQSFFFNSFDPLYLGAVFKEVALLPFLLAAATNSVL